MNGQSCLYPALTSGDGNCLFNSVSLLLYGTDIFAVCLRLACMVAAIQNTEDVKETVSNYIFADILQYALGAGYEMNDQLVLYVIFGVIAKEYPIIVLVNFLDSSTNEHSVCLCAFHYAPQCTRTGTIHPQPRWYNALVLSQWPNFVNKSTEGPKLQ